MVNDHLKFSQWPSLYSTCEHTIGLKPILLEIKYKKKILQLKNADFHQNIPTNFYEKVPFFVEKMGPREVNYHLNWTE